MGRIVVVRAEGATVGIDVFTPGVTKGMPLPGKHPQLVANVGRNLQNAGSMKPWRPVWRNRSNNNDDVREILLSHQGNIIHQEETIHTSANTPDVVGSFVGEVTRPSGMVMAHPAPQTSHAGKPGLGGEVGDATVTATMSA